MIQADREEPYIERMRRLIEEAYAQNPTGCGASFGEILCWELHSNETTFIGLSERWGLSLAVIGDLIADHCRRLAPDPCLHIQESAEAS